MHANRPSPDDLPSSATLFRSTAIAILAATLILVTIVLPAEYAIDPTGIGGLLGLTEVGAIKAQLHEEAQALSAAVPDTGALATAAPQLSPQEAATALPGARSDATRITLAPGESTEVKLVMLEGDEARYSWSVDEGFLNFDLHGDGPGDRFVSYEKGRAIATDEGVLTAAFDGSHGWFWRNRTEKSVTVTLETSGAYSDLKRL